ncbi:type I pullulanase [Gorillibacterium sp. sgz5001074]|uniref:type I pullulanase n=1 Tax=Gorillibacterium sp. sgz5001074 TaxID=3446695 RepID=UPI003F66274F
MAVQRGIDYEIQYGDPELTGGLSVFSREFDESYAYEGDDLGCHYNPDATSFVLWAPTASDAAAVLYDAWDGVPAAELPMTREERGVWRVTVVGDCSGKLYTYKVKISGQWQEAVDPYAKAVSVNGDKGAVLDLRTTNPKRWTGDRPPFEHPIDAIIYEVHIRDLTIHPLSGVLHKGKYLGACELGTKGPKGIPTGFDHIRSLGITHVQLLPVYDFATESVDETDPERSYNWGYDPKNYNAPEGSYASDPFDPAVRIRELKTLIQTCHDHGLRVIMDVVYNHVFDAFRVNFTKLVPGYYFRYKNDGLFSNGSGCGNDTASERPMMRKFIVDSVLYWAREYHLDGFRFDLMGLHDIETMREIRRRLDEIDPSIVMLGEGWIMPTELPEAERANQWNAHRLPGIGQFNDGIRDTLKGSVFSEGDGGFISGRGGSEHHLKIGITAAVHYNDHIRGYAAEPVQSVAYVEAHDNYTLWDKLLLSNPYDDEATRKRRHKLASALVLTSQGMAFLHAGQEFMRTKDGVENSYKSPDLINRMDWQRCAANQDGVEHIRRLTALRRKHPAFRMRTAEQIRRHLVFEGAPSACVAYTLRNHANGDPAKHLFVVHNGNHHPIQVHIPLPGLWTLEFGAGDAGIFDRVHGGSMTVQGISTVVLAVYKDWELEYYHV